ncbi:MAG: hypothetical protein AAF928_15790 [Myxococcota bacterium]
MNRRQAAATSAVGGVVLALAVFSAVTDPPAPEQICLQGIDRLEACREETRRPRIAAFARRKQQEGWAGCTRSEADVAMYETCLAKPSCDAFSACLQAYATPAPSTPPSAVARPTSTRP